MAWAVWARCLLLSSPKPSKCWFRSLAMNSRRRRPLRQMPTSSPTHHRHLLPLGPPARPRVADQRRQVRPSALVDQQVAVGQALRPRQRRPAPTRRITGTRCPAKQSNEECYAPASSSAWAKVFQPKVAHLMRTGNFTTPCRAASSPRLFKSTASGSTSDSSS